MWKWGENRVYSDELCHYGVKGQKWGVRRYQNPDGTLTEEGKARYKLGSLHKESEIREDFKKNIASKSKEIEHIRDLSGKLKEIQAERDSAYAEYYPNIKISKKEKQDLKKVIDSWYSRPMTDYNDRDMYDYEVHELIEEKLADDRPDHIRDIDERYYDASDEYWKAVNKFKTDLVKEYSGIEVYSTKKGILNIDIIDKRTKGEQFVEQLMDESKLAESLGQFKRTDENGKTYYLIGDTKYTGPMAEATLNKAIERLYKEIDVNWYNSTFKD